jgi:hypothetical protein
MTDFPAGRSTAKVSAWAIGGMTFAASMLILIGMFQLFAGLAAIVNDQFYVVARHYAFDLDVTAFGWIHLVIGALVIVTGFSLFAGRTWAAVTALVLAMVSAISNFFFIPYYPWWSIIIIALNAWVIWSLTRPGAVRT